MLACRSVRRAASEIRSRWFPELGWRAGALMLPSSMVPKVLLRRATHPSLERGRVAGNDPFHIRLEITGRCRVYRLEGEVEATRRLPQRDAEHDRRAETKGEDR